MDNIKSIFSKSADNVIITDYNFNILWFNKQEQIFSFYGENCSELFKNETLPLNSGRYYIKHGSLSYECNIINYPDCENGVYIIQTSSNDILCSIINYKNIQQIIENICGEIRSSIAGINLSNESLNNLLSNENLYEEQKYTQIIYGNCHKILKSSMNILELTHYSKRNLNIQKIDLSAHLEQFVHNSQNVLREKIRIESDIEPYLFISADPGRLTAFLLSAVLFASNENPENNIINISAEHIDNQVSITISTDQCGTDANGKKFSNYVKMYDVDETDTNMFVIDTFCKTFNGTPLIMENENGTKSFNIKLPFDNSNTQTLSFKSRSESYSDRSFSKYQIMYSRLMY